MSSSAQPAIWTACGNNGATTLSALASSGLFYEAHLRRWADGKLPLQTLQAEPQARQSPLDGLLQPPPLQSKATPAFAARLAAEALPTELLDAPLPAATHGVLAAEPDNAPAAQSAATRR